MRLTILTVLKQIEKAGKLNDLKRLEKLGPPPFTNHEKYVKFIKMVNSYGGGFDVSMGKLFSDCPKIS